MSLLCFHASQEQFAPSRLLQLAIMADAAGFDGIHSSDHFHPWSKRQGQSGFTLSWLGAAMQATNLPFSFVCAPGLRYHPAIVAQAIATLAEMFPSRINIELGSGEAINEKITGLPWPSHEDRNDRLLESASIIRRLLQGEEVTHLSRIKVRKAKLYTLPAVTPLLFCAAVSEETAGWAGSWADGLITTGDSDLSDTRKKVNAFQQNGGKNKPFNIQLSFSYAANAADAVDGAWQQWRNNLADGKALADTDTVDKLDALGETVSKERVAKSIETFTSVTDLLKWLGPFQQLGAAKLILHNVHPDQEFFIREFAQYKGKTLSR